MLSLVKRGKEAYSDPSMMPVFSHIKGRRGSRSPHVETNTFTSHLRPLVGHIPPAGPTTFTEPRPFQRQWQWRQVRATEILSSAISILAFRRRTLIPHWVDPFSYGDHLRTALTLL